MSRFANQRLTAIVTALSILALFAVALPTALQAQEEAAGLVVGTYEPAQVAQSVGFQQKMMQKMQGLQARMQKAQEEGDQEAMQQIQTEAQQAQQDATNELLADIEAVMPEVAETTGVQVVAVNVTYTATAVTTKDITQDIVNAMSGQAGSAEAAPTMDESAGDEGR
ncbi:MAG: hypothetical protein R3234_09810 [Thermoanaerobaculia bacterium]|nr:hypothetical protein [Thermoanaerobaculia bacterium]